MVDRTFWRHPWPFSVVKTVQWAGPFLVILCVYAFSWQVRDEYPSFTFVLLFSWCAFGVCLSSWLVHLFGLQRRTLRYGARFVFPPVAMIDFGWALVCAFFYAIFGLIALSLIVKGIDTSKYPEVSLAGNYALALLTLLFCAAACSSFVAFVFYVARGIPDEDLKQLSRIFIDGNRVAFVDEIDDETGIIMVNVNEYTPISSESPTF